MKLLFFILLSYFLLVIYLVEPVLGLIRDFVFPEAMAYFFFIGLAIASFVGVLKNKKWGLYTSLLIAAMVVGVESYSILLVKAFSPNNKVFLENITTVNPEILPAILISLFWLILFNQKSVRHIYK